MDSFSDDITLPLDLDASANITRFQDITNMSNTGEGNSNDQSSSNLLKMSPNTSRNMKDYATQISDLKKENFSLKLRIFYMEERMQQEFDGDHEQVFKTNIELKVECESLRKELQDKQDLLIKASNAMACIESSGSAETQQVREDARKELQQAKKAMDEKVQSAERELIAVQAEADILHANVKDLQDYVQELEEKLLQNEKMKEQDETSGDSEGELDSRKQLGQDDAQNIPEIRNLHSTLEDQNKLIEQLRESLKANQSVIEVLNDEKKLFLKAVEEAEQKNKDLEENLSKTKTKAHNVREDYMRHIQEQQEKLDEFESATRQMSVELEKKEKKVREMEDKLAEAEKSKHDMEDMVDGMKDETEKKNAKELLMRDKAITGLTGVIQKKDDEIARLQAQLESRESHLEELTNTINNLVSQDNRRDEKLTKLNEIERKLRESEELCQKLRDENQYLKDQLELGKDAIKLLNESKAAKDEEFDDLLAKYKLLEEEMKEDARNREKLLREQDEITRKFEIEKKEFTSLLDKTRREYEDMAKNAEEKGISRNVLEMQDKIFALESQLTSKQIQLDEARNLFRKAENERKSALQELEAAMKRRDEDQKREMDSKERISAAKSVEIDRLRQKLHEKEEKLQELEVDILQYDRSTREAEDMARLSGQEVHRWKEECSRKDGVINELIKLLEEFNRNAPGFDHKKLIDLIRHNNELKHLLHEEQSNFDNSFCQPNSARRSEMSLENAPNIRASLNNLEQELDQRKRELYDANNLISELTLELGNNQKQVGALQQTCQEKDQLISDLQLSAKPYHVESEECSTSADDDLEFPKFATKKNHKLVKRRTRGRHRSEMTSLSPESSHAKLRKERMGEMIASSSEDEFRHFLDPEDHLGEDVRFLKEGFENLKNELVVRNAAETPQTREAISRFDDILDKERDTYERYVNRSSQERGATEIDSTLVEQLSNIEKLRNDIRELLANKLKKDIVQASIAISTQTSHTELQNPPFLGPINSGIIPRTHDANVQAEQGIDLHTTQMSDTDTLSVISDDSDNLASLSRRELREFIVNIRKKLDNAEKLNQLLKNQIESGVKQGDELMKVTLDNQKLSENVKGLQSKLESSENGLRKSEVIIQSLQTEKEILMKQTTEGHELKLLNRQLQTKLSSTEETVRQQSEKLRRCHSVMEAAGLQGSPIRAARSTPDLLFPEVTPNKTSPHYARGRLAKHSSNETLNVQTQTADDTGYVSLSPRSENRYTSLIQTQSKDLSVLRKQLKNARTVCRDLQAELDLVSRYVSAILDSSECDSMMSSSVTTELERCKRLIRKLKENLSECASDNSGSENDLSMKSEILLSPEGLQLRKKNAELKEKQFRIESLEKQLHELWQEKHDINTQKSLSKGGNQSFMGLLTPSSSHHSFSAPDDNQATFLHSMVSQGTEYVPLPDPHSPRWQEGTPRSRRSMPMYQRTIAVTEYLPPSRVDSEHISQRQEHRRHRLPTSSDTENCTASYSGSWNALASRNLEESPKRESRTSGVKATQSENHSSVIAQHLSEIRLLRQRLENSIQTTDLLREELEKKLHDADMDPAGEEKFANEYDCLRKELSRSNDMNTKLQHLLDVEKRVKRNYETTASKLNSLRKNVSEVSVQTDSFAADLKTEVRQERERNESLKRRLVLQENEIHDLRGELKRTRMGTSYGREESSRMQEDLNRMREELDESRDLVRSLKSEVALYEKIHKNKDMAGSNSPGKTRAVSSEPFDISELLSEIKMLRIQLERSIEANRALRAQLEEQLQYSKNKSESPGTPAKTTTINIHHHSPSSSDQFPLDSPHNSERAKVKLDFSHAPNSSVLMTPPPSASSCGEDFGLNFSPLHGHSTAANEKQPVQSSVPAGHKRKAENWPCYNLHGPYVLGKLSDFETLKQRLTDGRSLSKTLGQSSSKIPLTTSLKERWDREKLKDLRTLNKYLEEGCRLIKRFWPASIDPPPLGPISHERLEKTPRNSGRRASDSSDVSKYAKGAGFGSTTSINSDVDGLRDEVSKLNRRLVAQDKLLQTTVSRLQNANRMKKGIEDAIMQQLSVTHDVIKKARGNLEAQAKEKNS